MIQLFGFDFQTLKLKQTQMIKPEPFGYEYERLLPKLAFCFNDLWLHFNLPSFLIAVDKFIFVALQIHTRYNTPVESSFVCKDSA